LAFVYLCANRDLEILCRNTLFLSNNIVRQFDHVSHKIIKKRHWCTTCFLHTHLELLWCFGTNEIASESSGIGRVLTYLRDTSLSQRWFCSLRS
jgi:hypothetical protein